MAAEMNLNHERIACDPTREGKRLDGLDSC